jgi:hypothetical protein
VFGVLHPTRFFGTLAIQLGWQAIPCQFSRRVDSAEYTNAVAETRTLLKTQDTIVS